MRTHKGDSYISKTYKETDDILGKGGEIYSHTLLVQWLSQRGQAGHVCYNIKGESSRIPLSTVLGGNRE